MCKTTQESRPLICGQTLVNDSVWQRDLQFGRLLYNGSDKKKTMIFQNGDLLILIKVTKTVDCSNKNL